MQCTSNHTEHCTVNILQSWAKQWGLGCVNLSTYQGSQEAGFAQPRAHSFTQLCTYPARQDLMSQVERPYAQARVILRVRCGRPAARPFNQKIPFDRAAHVGIVARARVLPITQDTSIFSEYVNKLCVRFIKSPVSEGVHPATFREQLLTKHCESPFVTEVY